MSPDAIPLDGDPSRPYTSRCLVDPAACQWTYAADRAVIRDAAWRQHYAAHQRGEDLRRRADRTSRPDAGNVSSAQPQKGQPA